MEDLILQSNGFFCFFGCLLFRAKAKHCGVRSLKSWPVNLVGLRLYKLKIFLKVSWSILYHGKQITQKPLADGSSFAIVARRNHLTKKTNSKVFLSAIGSHQIPKHIFFKFFCSKSWKGYEKIQPIVPAAPFFFCWIPISKRLIKLNDTGKGIKLFIWKPT
jgi:hypothetical protein